MLDPDVVTAFRRNGHVRVRAIVSPADLDWIRPVIARVVGEVAGRGDPQGRIDDYSRLFTQVTNIWRIDEGARRIIFDARFARAAAELLGTRSVRLYHDQALFKPAGAARTPWHRDSYYWPLDTDLTVTMWLPLMAVDGEMGPMIFASRSHDAGDLGDLSISEATDRRLDNLVKKQGWPVWSEPLDAGDATFHLGGTVHSAGANQSNRTREVLTIIYYAGGARVAVPVNENQKVDLSVFLPGLVPGDEAASDLNPVLFGN